MGRKNLLQGLMEGQSEGPAEGVAPPEDRPKSTEPPRPRYSGGAIGAVSQSIAELQSRALVDLDPDLIGSMGVEDRLEDSDSDHQALVASIRDYGQQVPVMVRPDPDSEGRYQVVYGRRRIRALMELGRPVRALVRTLDDQELLLAQGQENNARKDLSFIEKANFARQMRDRKYTRVVIGAALHVDKTVISRMLSVVDRLDLDVIDVIGAAPSIGRDRWLALVDLIDESKYSTYDARSVVLQEAGGEVSDKRFEILFRAISRGQTPGFLEDKTPPVQPGAPGSKRPVLSVDGDNLGYVMCKRGATVVTLSAKATDGFDDWLVQNLPRIHQDWKSGQDS